MEGGGGGGGRGGSSEPSELILNPPLCYNMGPRSAVGNVCGNRCKSDCRSRGREFDPGQVSYFRGD